MRLRNKVITGSLAGIASLALGAAAFAQGPGFSAPTGYVPYYAPAPTQACVQSLAAKDAAETGTLDAMTTAKKNALQARQTALIAAAGITNDSDRFQATMQANKDFMTALRNAERSRGSSLEAAIDDVSSACDGMYGFGMGRGKMHGKGKRGGMMGGW
ncbi:hypothetical protein A3A67_05310 [Candidatus Peribacteria bacterium RIFCSPLOWO2_01_FULL_51_18]|nr:MAG: hypothetical protein A3C52_04315 [Candidatus Peribacteria bacterium RIFCSPHIGHO2_02_FULL_51_15]OGJ66347.1 MAG: hypothetical protein A3A67_05310 [Candidatus Peribacteria bacterium RIFCSPLOWO2_01_FULL_51_18]OGJ67813.1 MAG: hypothetical protein A3J34_01540 [Candidatus Peribacteria bacterium RIFCSPLOWO2_02_FULL_51_10]